MSDKLTDYRHPGLDGRSGILHINGIDDIYRAFDVPADEPTLRAAWDRRSSERCSLVLVDRSGGEIVYRDLSRARTPDFLHSAEGKGFVNNYLREVASTLSAEKSEAERMEKAAQFLLHACELSARPGLLDAYILELTVQYLFSCYPSSEFIASYAAACDDGGKITMLARDGAELEPSTSTH